MTTRRRGRWRRVAQSQLRYYSGNRFIPIISNLPAIGRVLCSNQVGWLAGWPGRIRWLDTLGKRKGLCDRKKRKRPAVKLSGRR